MLIFPSRTGNHDIGHFLSCKLNIDSCLSLIYIFSLFIVLYFFPEENQCQISCAVWCWFVRFWLVRRTTILALGEGEKEARDHVRACIRDIEHGRLTIHLILLILPKGCGCV